MQKEQVQEAIKRIDSVLKQVNLPRDVHLGLVEDLNLVQNCCIIKFQSDEEKKDGGTDKPINNA